MSTFSGRLKEERLRLGFNQQDFADIGGVQRRAQVNYENGERSPDGKYLEAVAKKGVNINYVVTGERQPKPERYFSESEVKKAGHGWLSDAVSLEVIEIEDKETYDFLHALLMINLNKAAGVKVQGKDVEAAQTDLKTG